MNDVGICNLALGRVGQGASRPIQSITEDSEPARACHRVFEHMRDLLLRDYVWPFALRVQALSPVTDEVPGWERVYAMPANCRFIHAITDRATDPWRYGTLDRSLTAPYLRIANGAGTGMLIATRCDQAFAWFNGPATDLAYADPSFSDALAWRIAAEIALGLKASVDIAQYASQQFTLAVAVASANVSNERGQTQPHTPDNIRVRQ